ncbi:MAG: S-methyl-5'-thioadenosine phosphorylase [Candidatus Omnitrophota bacterium]|nr:S-methyl-5'-thioadenosine phosphorylase [Candidatus Omnitrophota bacterium]MDZ4241893.1 S-methyl-5'-thioadenosine phosphorylase [Candidatus Omnitrophota bacterium]
MAKVGIIGGSGLYQMEGLERVEELSLMTPFGQPSCNLIAGRIDGVDVVFLPRHGKGHRISPSEINYRANIFSMKKLGVEAIVSVSACGSLKEEIKPMDFVVPDQFVDWTKGKRLDTFFGNGIVAHVPMAQPVAPEIRQALVETAKELNITALDGGTYINIEGPQFSTLAESRLYRAWGLDIIGMTNVTEAKLAREAEISYATLAAVTDYDCWHPAHESVTVEMILDCLGKNVENAKKILRAAVPKIGRLAQFSAQGAMKYSIVTNRQLMPEDKKKELDLLIGKYLK